MAVSNLHEIMEELYSVGKKANRETVEEIMAGLEAMGTFIPATETVRREYRHVLLKEYEEFIETRERQKHDKTPPLKTPDGGTSQ